MNKYNLKNTAALLQDNVDGDGNLYTFTGIPYFWILSSLRYLNQRCLKLNEKHLLIFVKFPS